MELNSNQIQEILPHRYPFLLVDRITECEPGKYAKGIKCVSVNEMQVKKAGAVISLSKTELQLLVCLLENAGHILSKEIILEKVWGFDGQFVDDNTVTVNISRLKNKLGTDSIENVRGLGYLWTEKVNKK